MTPRWVPLVVDGKFNEALRRSTARASGAYAVRRRDSHTVVYVGESSRGVMWKTILRHFQPPGATRASFVVSDPSAYDVAIWKTSTGRRTRAAKRSADQRAMAAQARWIETLRPLHNTDDGKAAIKETAEYRETLARYEEEDRARGAFDGLLNPASKRSIADIAREVAAKKADRDRRLAAWVATRGTRPYEAIGRGGVRVLVSPDPSKPGRWRVTRFQGDDPTGHNEAETFEEAAVLAERDLGAPIPEVVHLEVTTRNISRNPRKKLDAFDVARAEEKRIREEAFRRLVVDPEFLRLDAQKDAALRAERLIENDRFATLAEKSAALDARREALRVFFAYEEEQIAKLVRQIETEERQAAAEKAPRKAKRNPGAPARHEASPRTLTALGLLTVLSYEDEIMGELVELRWSLAQAPTLAVDERGRLRVVYLGRVVRPSSKVERAAYRKLHWGQQGRGEVRGGGVAVPPLRTLGRGVSVTYTTRKGVDRKLVDYVHPWGEGGPRKFVPPLVVEHHCGSKRCGCEGALAFAGGTYVVEERGIVG